METKWFHFFLSSSLTVDFQVKIAIIQKKKLPCAKVSSVKDSSFKIKLHQRSISFGTQHKNFYSNLSNGRIEYVYMAPVGAAHLTSTALLSRTNLPSTGRIHLIERGVCCYRNTSIVDIRICFRITSHEVEDRMVSLRQLLAKTRIRDIVPSLLQRNLIVTIV